MEVLSRGWQTDLALLERSGSVVEHHPTYVVVRSPANPAFHWGNFLLLRRAPLRRDVDAVLQRFADVLPQARHVAIGIDDPEASVGELTGFTDRGLTASSDVVLTADDVGRHRPHDTDAVVRPVVSDADWEARLRLHLAVAGPGEAEGYREFLTRRVAAQRRLAESGTGTWFGAFVGGEMVSGLGVVAATPELGRYQGVETHPAWRRRGLAGELVHTAGRHALDVVGSTTLVIVAEPDQPAIGLYRGLGFADTERQVGVQRTPA